MNSENPPAIYTLAALRALPEWNGVEGIGYIVNKNMLSDLFGSDNGELVLTELSTCSWD